MMLQIIPSSKPRMIICKHITIVAVLAYDVAVVVIHHRIDGHVVYGFGQQLPHGVVGVLGYPVYTIGYLGDAFFRIVLIRKGSSAGKHDLAYQLRGGAGF